MEITKENLLDLLDSFYKKSETGYGKIIQPIEDVAKQYKVRNKTIEKAAKTFINSQILKCTTTGFVTGLGGLITLPISVPADIGSNLFVQIRMIQGIAYLGGYNIHDDQVRSLIYLCLAGISVNSVVKSFGIKFSTKITTNLIKKIPAKVIQEINKKVTFRLLSRAGEKSLINLTKLAPVIGGPINAGFDFIETKIIADRAYKLFIENNFEIGEDL